MRCTMDPEPYAPKPLTTPTRKVRQSPQKPTLPANPKPSKKASGKGIQPDILG